MNRQEKAQIIERLNEKAGKAGIAVVTDFKGMTVEEITDLRVKLRDVGVDYQVVRNTLARLALKGTNHEVLKERLKENCAIALGYDEPVTVAKVLSDFAKNSKKFAVKYGALDGKFVDAAGLQALAKLPGKQELLGMLLGTMNAVPTSFVGLLANVPRSFLYALTAIKEQKEAA